MGDGNIEKPPALKAKGVIRISMVPLYDYIIYIYMIFYILMSLDSSSASSFVQRKLGGKKRVTHCNPILCL